MTEKWETVKKEDQGFFLSFFLSFFLFEGAAFLVFLGKDFKRAFINTLMDSKEKKYIIKKQMRNLSRDTETIFLNQLEVLELKKRRKCN